MNKSSRPYFLLMAIILATGFILRFWNYWNMPFAFDELSAMSRTVFDSFAEMIRVGVVEKDSHPAGVQTFLYYWVKIFGDNEMVVKLPFLLAGLVSIWLAYRIGTIWFNRTAGILTAACISSLQFFVLYSQMARPYSSGLFMTLVMVLYWSKYFFKENKVRYLIGFVIFGALSAYNHYISLLFVATVGLSGLVFTSRKTFIPYVLSGLGMFLLYLPHLWIFFAQAEKGTIGGWLGAPGDGFMWEFFRWMFHYSYFSMGLFVGIIVVGLILYRSAFGESDQAMKKRLILFVWLLPTPVFGYIYSYTVEPILQFSLLIFSVPYFFLLAFSFIRDIPVKQLSIVVGIILLVNTLTLVFNRLHYKIFYKQPFELVVREAIRLQQENPDEVFMLNDYIPYYSEYYFKKYDKTIPYFTVRNKEITDKVFDSIVSNINQSVVITSGLPPHYFHIVQRHFPYWIGYDNGFTFEQYVFSRKPHAADQVLKSTPIAVTHFEGEPGKWRYDTAAVVMEDSQGRSVYPMHNREWGPLIEFSLDSLSQTGFIFVDVKAKIIADSGTAKGIVVSEIKDGETQIAWRGTPFSTWGTRPHQISISATLDIQVMLGNKMETKDRTIKIYLWNRDKTSFSIVEMETSWRKANPCRYALFSDFTPD